MKYRTTLRNPPYLPFSKGGINKKILLPPLKKGGWGDFDFLFFISHYVISILIKVFLYFGVRNDILIFLLVI